MRDGAPSQPIRVCWANDFCAAGWTMRSGTSQRCITMDQPRIGGWNPLRIRLGVRISPSAFGVTGSGRGLSALRVRDRRVQFVDDGLRRAFQPDKWQVRTPTEEVDFERESIAGLSGDERARSGTGRAAWPAYAWLDAWSSIRRTQSEVDLVRSPAVECCGRAIRVVPGDEAVEPLVEGCAALRNQDSTRAFVFHGPDTGPTR
jgi:hypothetical protein